MHTNREIARLVLSLPESERAALAVRLLASLPNRPGSLDDTTAAQIQRELDLRKEPNLMRYTFKVDASYHLPRKVTGIGIVIHASDQRGKNGRVIDQVAELYAGVPPNMPEKFAVLRALELARVRNYQKVIIRSDCREVRKPLSVDLENKTRAIRDPVHALILEHAACLQEVRFPYHPRRKNGDAHKLARHAVRELQPKPCPGIFRDGIWTK